MRAARALPTCLDGSVGPGRGAGLQARARLVEPLVAGVLPAWAAGWPLGQAASGGSSRVALIGTHRAHARCPAGATRPCALPCCLVAQQLNLDGCLQRTAQPGAQCNASRTNELPGKPT